MMHNINKLFTTLNHRLRADERLGFQEKLGEIVKDRWAENEDEEN